MCPELHLQFPKPFDMTSVPSSLAFSHDEMRVWQGRWIGNQRTWSYFLSTYQLISSSFSSLE